ncbi:MAG: hypothetical protein U0289_16830 [Cyclobacteriaceae bacterium]
MYTKCWQIIRDDRKKTCEVVGPETNLNHFTNMVHGMQKLGMSVSCLTPPVSNKTSSKDRVQVQGYTREEGLFDRLVKEYRQKTSKDFDGFDDL